MLKAALFDMDGLLFDTEAMYARLANEAARPLGFAFTEQMILDTLGVNETDCNAYYGRHPGLPRRDLLAGLSCRGRPLCGREWRTAKALSA